MLNFIFKLYDNVKHTFVENGQELNMGHKLLHFLNDGGLVGMLRITIPDLNQILSDHGLVTYF